MSYEVVLSLEAVDDVVQITMASQSKAAILTATKQLQDALMDDPAGSGEHLSEGLFFIDREPLRGFYTIDTDDMMV